MRTRSLSNWWPLAALMLLAAVLRFATLDLQSFWYDEAFTPVHVLHPGLGATLRAVSHTENTPPLWYVLIWGVSRVLGSGEVALRSLSAVAGVATVPVAWGIGQELAGRRVALASAAFVAVNPLFVWYSQEARAYALFILLAALSVLCFLRVLREPTGRRLAAFAVASALALLTHYFAVFLLSPMCVWLLVLGHRERRYAVLWSVAAVGVIGVALIPLISAQGGHGTQWIGRWALASRLEAIPQYYLTGYSGGPLGHGVELLVALLLLAGIGYGLWSVLEPREERGALIALLLSACGVLIPVALVAFGADYLAPRNLVAAMIPITALVAVVIVANRTGWVGMAIAGLIALVFLAISIDVNLSPRLQRGDWRGVAHAIASPQVITTVELGAAPLEYYLPPLHNLARGATVRTSEIDETGYAPLRSGAGSPPAPGFHFVQRRDINGLILYRFTSPVPLPVSEAVLRSHVITLAHPEVLVR
ncbi:MAG TPA: glycosyltransferase family 39 protein [Solirubrobacteraceae bacterium]